MDYGLYQFNIIRHSGKEVQEFIVWYAIGPNDATGKLNDAPGQQQESYWYKMQYECT